MYAHGVPASGGHDFKSGCFRIWTPYSLFLAKGLVVSSAYLKLFSVLPAIFTPSFASSISAFLIILCAYRLNKNGDKMQPCRTPFLILYLTVSPNYVLITADWSSYNPLSSCIRCFGIPISSKVFHNSS